MSEEPTRKEKKAFMRVLSSLAWADGVLADEEFQQLHLTASDLQVSLSERDLEERDLDALAGQITHTELREKLLAELANLAMADDDLDAAELSTIKYFATRWSLAPPELPGVEDWDLVPLPGEGA